MGVAGLVKGCENHYEMESINAFYFGPTCKPEEPKCLYFGLALGVLKGEIVEAQSGEPLPGAQISLEDPVGIQEYTGNFSLPWNTACTRRAIRDLVGVIDHSYGTKLGSMHFFGADRSRGSGDMLDIPSYGQEISYTFRLGASAEDPSNPGPATPGP